MRIVQFQIFILLIVLVFKTTSVYAIWFEASGQAVIHDGQKEAARRLATQEAIKQALMFAGASVKSVQKMANGLLEDDRLEISASGEVNNIELIDEIYHSDYVTVSIRADIFPQETLCSASDYKKTLVTTWYGINKRQQAAEGNLYDFGKTLAEKLAQTSQQKGRYSLIKQVEPYYIKPAEHEKKELAFNLARKTNSQFVLFGEITEFSVEVTPNNSVKFWQDDKVERNLGLTFSIYDGLSGEKVFHDTHSISAPWEFNRHKSINSNGQVLWRSSFGIATQQILQQSFESIDESLSCLPAYGRVIKSAEEQLTINIGTQHGVKVGDNLTLFKMNEFYDPQGQPHRQYLLFPTTVLVTQAFGETSTVKAADGALLMNIQPNDFVARQ